MEIATRKMTRTSKTASQQSLLIRRTSPRSKNRLGQQKLTVSEIRNRRPFEANQDGMLVIEANTGKIIDVNPSLIEMLGYSRKEFLGKQLWEIDLFKEILPNKDAFKRLHEKKYIRHEHLPLITRDGKSIDVEFVSNTYLVDGREVIQCNIRDITERKRTEEELRRQALIYKNIHDSIIVVDLQGNIVSWNPAAERMFGYDHEEILRKTIGVLVTKVVKGMLRDGHWTGEMNFTRKDGIEGVCETSIFPLRDEYGDMIAVFGVCRDITEHKRSAESLQRSYDQLRETLIATVNTLASTVEMRDPYTAGHQRRVTILACAIAAEMGLTEDQFDGLRMAGLIHDLGKITVPTEILSKPGRITEIEFGLIRYHPQICHDILKTIELPWPVAKIVLQHHERLDGSGYPQGLMGDEIIMEARILAVADVVEAMASHRPYRPALGIELAFKEITTKKGILYDPEVVDACVRLFSEKRFKFD
jgi:PAS domain S-box-containing protein